ncbi:hypothetical protein [Lignipirellula cremea]|uniref:hypothetical protein n=1 Tax=Lignipirellula cremea TaxID=2528010 RepID=UPI0011A090C1|nr:hypothetical protein [Lignipirellula cremea]
MVKRFPNLSEIAAALHAANERPDTIRDAELRNLTQVLRASYDEQFQRDYSDLSHDYLVASDGCDLQQDIAIALSHLPSGAADWIVSDLVRFFASDPQFYELAHALLALAFPPTATDVEDVFVHGDMQQDVLAALIRNEEIWRSDMTFRDRLTQYGLPTHREGVTRLIDEAGSLG